MKLFRMFGRNIKFSMLLDWSPVVACGNDANVAALGEMWKGGGKGCKNP